MDKLMKFIDEHADEYVKYLVELVKIDTHDIEHGIGGGRERGTAVYEAAVFLHGSFSYR